jgi:hypothetical protein
MGKRKFEEVTALKPEVEVWKSRDKSAAGLT